MNDKDLLTLDFINKASSIHGNKYDYSETEYIKALEKVKIICPKHGPFFQTPHDHLAKKGCPKCGLERLSKLKTKSTEQFIEEAKLVHNNKYDYSKVNYVSARENVVIICKEEGHGEFLQTPDNHLNGKGCPICAKAKRENTMLERYGTKYANSSPIIQAKTKENNLSKYGVDHPMKLKENVDKAKTTNLQKYGTEWPLQSDLIVKKMFESNIKKYGATSPMMLDEFKNKIINTNFKRYGVKWPMLSDSVKKKALERLISSNLEKYGVKSPMSLTTPPPGQTLTPKQKGIETKRKNGTFNTSKPEDELEIILKDNFPNIYRNYNKDQRYPFMCDFYIPSKDLFIELNLHWTHGGKWFNPSNKDDVLKLEKWKEKSSSGSKYYANAIKVWTERDVFKRNMAKKNKLNYVVLWNLEDINNWVSSNFEIRKDF